MTRTFEKILFVLLLMPFCFGIGPASVHGEETVEEMIQIRAGLTPVSLPDLAPLDPMVAEQLRRARLEMETNIADPTASIRQLASAYGALGQIYHAYELLDVARECYSNSIRLEPHNFAWFHLQADVSRLQARLEDAVSEFQTAWSLEPRDFAAVVNTGTLLIELNRDDEARKVFLHALSMAPGSPSVMAGLGQLALRDQAYEEAVAYFKAALTAMPEANRLHYSLAMAYRGLGDMDNAKIQLEQRGTVGIKPPDPLLAALQPLREGERVHLVRGRLAFAAERYEEAKTEFELAVKADPESARALVNLGATLAKLGDLDGAITFFEQAIEVDPASLTARFNLGSLLANRGDFEQAVPHLRKVADEQPEDAEAQLTFARCLAASGDDLGAIPYFRLAASLDPGRAETVVEGSATLVRLDRYKEAVSVLEAGLERLSESIPIAYALSRLLASCPDGTIRNGERALALSLALQDVEPKPQHMQLIAQSLAELGDCSKAAEWQQQLVEAAKQNGMDDVADALQIDLDQYRQGPPCRPPVMQAGPES